MSDAGHAGRSSSPYHSSRAAPNPSPLYSASLSHEHITDALVKSPDNGATLDLTHRGLTDVGEAGAEELATIGMKDEEDESTVMRIALGYNRLATLPMAFALLSRLRYLTLKNNSFSVFPDVLTVMPSLEILDISRNKIKRLPSQPGSLINLRVFSISRNKVSKLPSYLADFRNLNILKTDHNPIEWPPKNLMESGNLEDPQRMKAWIRSIQRWMMENGLKSTGGRKRSDESMSVDHDLESAMEESFTSWSRFGSKTSLLDAVRTPHGRTFSMDSELSIYSDTDASRPPSRHNPTDSSSSRVAPRELHLGTLPSFNPSRSPSRSPDSYLPTPAESVDDDVGEDALSSLSSAQRRERDHMRGLSYTAEKRNPQPLIPGKKSLPDLRTAKMNFEQRTAPLEIRSRAHQEAPPALPIASTSKVRDEFAMPSPLSHREDSGSSEGKSGAQPLRPFAHGPMTSSPTAMDRPAPAMDVERNSYFRRMSMLPTSTIANTLPKPLLSLIDSARSILFAVCQVYQTLQHYTVYAIDDRLSSVLRKVLDPASTYMMQLITTLDRFDAMSRKTLPSPMLCRSVIEATRDTVAVFGKAVGVLALQLKVLATHDDVRYLRQMLLILYGATAEISHAWQAMIPHIDAVKPLLRDRRPPMSKSAHAGASPTHATVLTSVGSNEPAPTAAPPAPPFSSQKVATPTSGTLRVRHTPQSSPAIAGRTHTARRHAGSFSYKDVEIGKTLPSYDDVPAVPASAGGAQAATLRPRFGMSPAVSPAIANPVLPTPSPSALRGTTRPPMPWTPHSRQGSGSSLHGSSAASSPAVAAKGPAVELPPNSRTLVDKEALDAMKLAVEAAPAVWQMIDDISGDIEDAKIDVQDSLDRAKVVTERLRENIRDIQRGDSAADRKTLREDAHVFVKTVVQLSNIIKQHGGAHNVSAALRSNMVKLTNSTEEFVILLHVSSFSETPAPRPYSPMVSTPQAMPSPQVNGSMLSAQTDENRLTPNLSRSRSAQAAATAKLLTPISRDGPRSALPSQSFKINGPLRPGYGAVRDGGLDISSQG